MILSRVYKTNVPARVLTKGNFIDGDLIIQWLQSVMFLFGRHIWGSPIGQ